MDQTEILIITGSPGSGKTSLAQQLSQVLISKSIAHAWIDVDDLCKVSPNGPKNFKWDNLFTILPNYLKLQNTKIILPGVIESADNLAAIKKIAAPVKITVCELIAPTKILIQRVVEREPNEYWRQTLREAVKNYTATPGDFTISTDHKSVEAAADSLLERLKWNRS